MAPTLEQVSQWSQEADLEFEKYYKPDFAGAMHPAIRIKMKQAYRKGYIKAMFKQARQESGS